MVLQGDEFTAQLTPDEAFQLARELISASHRVLRFTNKTFNDGASGPPPRSD